MAASRMNLVFGFVFLGCSLFALAAARGVRASQNAFNEDRVDISQVTQNTMTSDVVCGVLGCEYDLNLYCLNNGVIVMGSCSLKNMLCTNGVRNELQLANGWDVCFQATYTVQSQPQEARNIAARTSSWSLMTTSESPLIPLSSSLRSLMMAAAMRRS